MSSSIISSLIDIMDPADGVQTEESQHHQAAQMSHYRTTMPSEGSNRHTSYPAYMTAQMANTNHHDSPSQGQHSAHLSDSINAVMSQFSSLSIPAGSQLQAHPAYCATQEQPVAYPGYSMPVHVGMAPEAAYSFGISGQFPVQGGFAPLPITYAMPYTPGRITSYATDRNSEVPGLENRRGSYSTTESTPTTPFFGSISERSGAGRVSVFRSSFNTPSPEQISASKPSQQIDGELLDLLKQDPTIPRAVPALFTPPSHTKTLEQCLENRIQGNRNVYIRGLHPTTDDDLLLRYASRFGMVEQSKAIIDTATGACKGFGFAKFADVRDSEKCIRGFYHLGYEVGFARESFNARLKAEGDETSTNLYLSNLPKRLNEAELNAIFDGYRVVSSKILRDSMGNSRGVGFARFETREECEEIIKKFHGASIGDEGMILQVRYADTPAQKELKRITAERRQFRTNEYNLSAYGTADVGIHPSIYSPAPWNRRVTMGASTPFARVPSIRTNIISSASTGTIVAPTIGHTPKQSASVPGTASSDDGLGGDGTTVVDSPTAKKGSTQSSPANKEKA